MVPDAVALDEVVVVAYGSYSTSSALNGSVSGIEISDENAKRNLRKKKTAYQEKKMMSEVVSNQTTLDFDIKGKYSVSSDNKNVSLDMVEYSLPAEYQYFSVPKVNKSAFLIAKISNWEKFNFLAGEANIFFENTYIGKTILDVSQSEEKMEISLGVDRNVVIEREKVKEYTSRQFIGSKKEETKAWRISVKNNKAQEIKIKLSDQIPVSINEDISVELEEKSNGKLDEETGEIVWEIELDSKAKKELELKYSVKSPKSMTVIID